MDKENVGLNCKRLVKLVLKNWVKWFGSNLCGSRQETLVGTCEHRAEHSGCMECWEVFKKNFDAMS